MILVGATRDMRAGRCDRCLNGRAALVRGALTTAALAAIYQFFFRYEFFHTSGLNVVRVDRLTASSCLVRLPTGALLEHRSANPFDDLGIRSPSRVLIPATLRPSERQLIPC